MPSFDWSPVDEAIREMEDIGYDGWLAKQAYIRGDITLEEFEAVLDETMTTRL